MTKRRTRSTEAPRPRRPTPLHGEDLGAAFAHLVGLPFEEAMSVKGLPEAADVLRELIGASRRAVAAHKADLTDHDSLAMIQKLRRSIYDDDPARRRFVALVRDAADKIADGKEPEDVFISLSLAISLQCCPPDAGTWDIDHDLAIRELTKLAEGNDSGVSAAARLSMSARAFGDPENADNFDRVQARFQKAISRANKVRDPI